LIQELSVDGKDIIENKQRFSDRECCYLTLRRPLKERKEKIYDILFFEGKNSSLRSSHLILWSLETLTDQQSFYGTWLVMLKERYYYPKNILLEVDCIVSFVLKC
jgi:hypothetical protein